MTPRFPANTLVRAARLGALIAALALPATAQDLPKPVKLITVTRAEPGLVRQFFGTVVARQTVDLAFQVSGQILSFPIVEGQTVPEGGLIAQLDQVPFNLALDQARLQLDQARRTVERLSKLSGSAVSEVSLQDAETAAGLAEIAVRTAETNLEHATLHAPFDALVAARNVANFTTVSAGTPVARLHDMSEIRIEIDVPEVLFQRAGADPNVSFVARFPYDEREFPLEVREYNAETSTVGQSFRLTFGMERPEGLSVLPGSSATVTARLVEGEGAIILPTAAVATSANGATSVMVFEPAGADTGTLTRVPVTLAADGLGQFTVTEGLEPGSEIVAAGANAVEDGQSVRRFTGFSN